ncbi:MAG: enoyl-CoA hydratase/isomerase family protein, partial [Actinomycetota bacterium]|nr:enoyl-CoA hydratase/isomerase family protein [Actinomycetota bacterium]
MNEVPPNNATTDAPHALISEDSGVITVTLNRPNKLGAISPEVTQILWTAVDEFGSRPDLRVMVITGTGRYFSAGLDLKLGHGGRVPGPEALGRDYRRGYRSHHLLYDELEAIEKPVILAANGPCIGSGTEMAVSCDFRFCTPDSRWGLPEIRSMGAIPGSGGISRLTRLTGTHWTKWLAMAAQEISAEEARMIGLVHAIHPADELMARVRAFADELIAIDPESLALAKLTI